MPKSGLIWLLNQVILLLFSIFLSNLIVENTKPYIEDTYLQIYWDLVKSSPTLDFNPNQSSQPQNPLGFYPKMDQIWGRQVQQVDLGKTRLRRFGVSYPISHFCTPPAVSPLERTAAKAGRLWITYGSQANRRSPITDKDKDKEESPKRHTCNKTHQPLPTTKPTSSTQISHI